MVGHAGLGRALIIIGLANIISILTSVSLSAIATNIKVKGGGDYYLISRTLGVEFGGSIGIVLFLAQAVSIAFYCIGFGEALAGMLPATLPLSPRIVAFFAVSFLFVLAWLGADWATRFQYVVMGPARVLAFLFFLRRHSQIRRTDARTKLVGPVEKSRLLDYFCHFFPGRHRLYPGGQHVRRSQGPWQKPSPRHLRCRRDFTGGLFLRGPHICRIPCPIAC